MGLTKQEWERQHATAPDRPRPDREHAHTFISASERASFAGGRSGVAAFRLMRYVSFDAASLFGSMMYARVARSAEKGYHKLSQKVFLHLHYVNLQFKV